MSGSGPPSQNVSRETSSEPAPPVVPPRVLTSLDAEIGGDTWLLPELEPRYNKLRTDEQRTFRRLGLHHHLQKYGLDLIDWIRDTNGNEEPPEQFFRKLCMDPLEPPESTSNGTVYQCGKKSCGKVDTFQHLRSHWRAKSHLGIAFFRCHICPQALFFQQQDLNRHLKKKHGIGRLERNNNLAETRMTARQNGYIPKHQRN